MRLFENREKVGAILAAQPSREIPSPGSWSSLRKGTCKSSSAALVDSAGASQSVDVTVDVTELVGTDTLLAGGTTARVDTDDIGLVMHRVTG